MLKLIVTIDSLRGIVESPNEDIEQYISSKLAGRTSVYARNGHLQAVLGSQDEKSYIESLANSEGLIWLRGGSELFELALPYAKEIIIIQLNGVFEVKEYFPHFEDTFYMEKRKPIREKDGLMYQFQLWKPDLSNLKESWDFDIREDV